MKRILTWPLVQLVIGAVALTAVFLGLQAATAAAGGILGFQHSVGWSLISFACIAAGALATYLGFVAVIERRKAVEVFESRAASHAALGTAVGTILFSATIGTLYLLGLVSFSAGTIDAAARSVGFAACSAVFEELLLRALLFRLVERCFGSAAALLASATLFGIAHATNPGANAVSTAALAVEAGLLLAAAFMATRTIWLPVGIHFGWNATEAALFGATESGFKVEGILKTSVSGPAWLGGGRFGVEASLIAVIWCVAAAALLLYVAQRRGQWQSAKLDPAGRLVTAAA